MVKPKEKRKIKKRAPRKKKGDGAPLPKSVQALLKYLSGGGTGFGPPPGSAAAQFQAAAPPVAQVAGVAKAPRKKKATASAAVPSPLQNIVPQAAAQTTIIQVPAAAPQQEKTESQSDIATLQATTKQQAGEIRNLQLGMTQQGAGALNAQFFQDIQKQIQEQEQRGLPSMSLRTSQAPSYLNRPPSAPSWAGRSSMRGSESGGEPVYETGASRASSVSQSQQSIADVMEQEASGLGAFLGGQYIQSVSNPVIPGKKMGAGRPSKSEEEKAATKAAAAQRRKEAKQAQAQAQQQTHSQSLAQLSSLGSVASSESSNPFSFMGRGRGKGKAQQIYSQAQQAGADPASTIQAMVAGGGAAAVQQIGGGLSLGELAMQKKQKGKKK
jgi:hypothetical protein